MRVGLFRPVAPEVILPHCSKHSRFVRRLGLLLVMCRWSIATADNLPKKTWPVSYLPAESLDDMLALDVVRSYPVTRNPKYRPPPHDCLLHFSAKSIYFSLTQLLIRTSLAQSAEPPIWAGSFIWQTSPEQPIYREGWQCGAFTETNSACARIARISVA